MKYLYVHEDGRMSVVESEPTQEDLLGVDDGVMDIVKFENGEFQHAVVTSENVVEAEDEDEDEDPVYYELAGWEVIK